ncbi:hypothetical protein NW752_000525 [Fusarium irregulare]|uniref:Duf1665 domain containing protein n=1 Tax=Fusarium irregulare TaxID=2494466 RepID=A0A9W8PZR7_9HYPO|nr:hypothetical protein NW766_001305 [Fusarium irregulare]KAJ4028268.1 hypothetical protein NW752_000525 [Fusarium irregulare]
MSDIKLPGFGLPLNYMMVGKPFPVVLGEYEEPKDWKAKTLTIRETCMLKVIEDLTNKPEWWLKVNDPEIAAKWKKEATELPWADFRQNADFTQEMASACIEELRKKADLYQKTGLIPVMDYSSAAIKSDNLISQDLRQALKDAVAPLEDVPEDQKDWHPGSDGKVLDIVHPSLWPLCYGQSRILPNKRINVEEALAHCGKGVVVPEDPKFDAKAFDMGEEEFDKFLPNSFFSKRFQWLPCDVDLAGEHPRIDSYINNAHPIKHAALYPVVEKFIEKSLPAWDVIYRWHRDFQLLRIVTRNVERQCRVPDICSRFVGCTSRSRPLEEGEPPRPDPRKVAKNSDCLERDREWFERTHPEGRPEPNYPGQLRITPDDVKTSGWFNNASHIQVIVKLANIHLTPEKPTYDGGSWHIEGQLNEHICATALYYYDCENITESRLDFRTSSNKEDLMMELRYEQSDYDGIEDVFAIDARGDTIQNIGSVSTRQDRMLFFPNVYQHHVSPFELADKSRPGHRKILALFLVDPLIPVISTANVPPQQRHWFEQSLLEGNNQVGKLPPEITHMVVENMDFPIGLDEAKEIRAELMAERTGQQEMVTNNMRSQDWNFCEH